MPRRCAATRRLLGSYGPFVVFGEKALTIKTADHVIDLGPEGGHAGGRVVVTGTPEDVARCKASHTGRYLKPHLRARGTA